jgi:hypothetical protein
MIFTAFVAGCGTYQQATLPTTTPAPILSAPTVTATFIPPPTVTLYPTATVRTGEADVIIVTATVISMGVSSSVDSPTQSQATQAQPQPGATLPVVMPIASSSATQEDFPAGISIGDQIFFADFFMGWPAIDEASAKIQLDNGKYRFEVGPYNAKFLYTTVVDQANLYASIEATLIDCPARGGFGLMYRFVDSSNYYLVTLFCDNTYTVVARINGSITGIDHGNLPDGVKLTPDQTYTLGVMAKDQSFDIYLNGNSIASFTDNRINQGDVALYAASQGDHVTRILFDNLKVWAVR